MTMNKTTKALSFAVAMFAIAGLMVAFTNQEAYARPQPTEFEVKEHVMKINLKGTPNPNDAKCKDIEDGVNNIANNIYMFVPTDTRGGNHDHVDVEQNDDFNRVTDNCTESIDNDRATLEIDTSSIPDGYMLFVTLRMLGPPAGDLKFCDQKFSLHEVPDTHCDLALLNPHSGKPTFQLNKKLFDDDLEDQVWSLSGNGKFRIAQIDIWIGKEIVA